jgi:hypothetical protein
MAVEVVDQDHLQCRLRILVEQVVQEEDHQEGR